MGLFSSITSMAAPLKNNPVSNVLSKSPISGISPMISNQMKLAGGSTSKLPMMNEVNKMATDSLSFIGIKVSKRNVELPLDKGVDTPPSESKTHKTEKVK
ncbi:hypothetical protein PPL_12485 [Heterostelium album PN500]|uniref:Uncharacterized protein n=1 Tax=Heterostelium pallidum (strain ATCC 26659 / Pp 5 / PN500) TaxID=670386 RepID=D3BMR2_HETP5|nr:hypothetical protein PPL_12485 [Heterostelium album PN500]EFA77274.1 hypothetical protein PPL_12485 [Heterostelium album PN500]|eukprot:XP_020429403.1 hypothetical protein PPL_12485 [Heterostelium album PN500]